MNALEILDRLIAFPSVVGTPNGAIVPILAHEGKVVSRVSIKGRPDLGLNAHECTAKLAQGPFDLVFEPPYSSLQVGTVRGGSALNIFPDHCELARRAAAALVCGLVGAKPIAAVSYDTEAGLFQQMGICGPGAIARAHKPNGFLHVGKFESGIAMLNALTNSCCH